MITINVKDPSKTIFNEIDNPGVRRIWLALARSCKKLSTEVPIKLDTVLEVHIYLFEIYKEPAWTITGIGIESIILLNKIFREYGLRTIEL